MTGYCENGFNSYLFSPVVVLARVVSETAIRALIVIFLELTFVCLFHNSDQAYSIGGHALADDHICLSRRLDDLFIAIELDAQLSLP